MDVWLDLEKGDFLAQILNYTAACAHKKRKNNCADRPQTYTQETFKHSVKSQFF